MKRALLFAALAFAACGPKEQGNPPAEKPKTERGLEIFPSESGTTGEIFKPEGIKALQEKLNVVNEKSAEKLDAGLPDAGGSAPKNEAPENVDVTGKLDTKTQQALGAFQKVNGLPETGLPDYETLDRLGFKPSDLFHRRPPATRGRKE